MKSTLLPTASIFIAALSALMIPHSFAQDASVLTHELIAVTGGPVDSAGATPGIPPGAVWTMLGSPAMHWRLDVAFVGRWRAPATAVAPAQHGSCIFIASSLYGQSVTVKSGDPVPGIAGATWKNFGDPIYTGYSLTYQATISGPGVTAANDTVLVKSSLGQHRIVAREGDPAPGTGGALYAAFVSKQEDCTMFDARLRTGTGSPAVTEKNNRAVFYLGDPYWAVGANEVGLSFRKGDGNIVGLLPDFTVGVLPGETLKSYRFLEVTPGSPGQGRRSRHSLWRLGSGRTQLQWITPGSAVSGAPNVSTGFGAITGGDSLPESQWAKVSIPAANYNDYCVMLASLVPGIEGVTRANALGIFKIGDDDDGWEPYVRTGDAAPGTGGVFTSMGDPLSPNYASVTFLGRARGGAVSNADDTGIWWGRTSTSQDLKLIAREGAQPPDAPAGAKWKSFTSLALPYSSAPLFTAKLQRGLGGITAASDTALYCTDYLDAVHELIRTGQPLLGRTVRSINALQASAGNPGVTRQFEPYGYVVLDVRFTDGTNGVVKISVPNNF